MAREVAQILHGQQNAARALRDAGARGGEEHAGRGALDQDDAELRLELADLHAHRRLGDLAARGGLAEMQRLGERREVAQLLEGRHGSDFLIE